MLSTAESKVVISTLTKRRAWLKKALEDANLDPAIRKEHTTHLTLLESAMKKLSAQPTSSSAASANPVAPLRKEVTMDNLRVLVAEDQESSLEVMVALLEDVGVKLIETAKDGREAFDKIKSAQLPFDVVLCDWDMPELSGLEVHQKASASKTLRGAHFCMVTGVTEAMKIREAIQQGVNDYVVKPVDPETLAAKLKATIEARN